jgi:hypothetical protein
MNVRLTARQTPQRLFPDLPPPVTFAAAAAATTSTHFPESDTSG